MPRILTALALAAPSAALAHPGAHDFGATGTLIHSLSQPDHLLALAAALAIPVAAAILIRRRFK